VKFANEKQATATVKHEVVVAKPEAKITYTVSAAKNVITVNFANAEDLTDAALSRSNFTLGSEYLPAGSVLKFVNNKKTIQITLPSSYAVTEEKTVTFGVQNVVDVKGNTQVLSSQIKTVTLTDNVAPTTSGVAKVSSSFLASVDFSEKLKATATVSGVVVKANGVVVDASKVTVTIGTDEKSLNIEFKEALKDDKVIVTVELAKDTNLTDAADNVAIVK